MQKAYRKVVWSVVMLFGMTTSAFADNAPVFEVDADRYPPAFDNSAVEANPSQPMDHQLSPEVVVAPARPLTLQQRLTRMEQQINNMQHSDAMSKMESLQHEVQLLRSQVEELNHFLQQIQSQQRTMYTDLDNRLVQMASKPKEVAEAASIVPKISDTLPISGKQSEPKAAVERAPLAEKAPQLEQPNPTEEQHIYQTAYDLIKAKKYNDAILTLKKMLQKYPTGQFAANAHYWLGELYGLLNKNDQSAREFSDIVKNFPESPKVPDAELKLGLIYVAQFKWVEAKAAFKNVVSHFPGSASARLATEQLRQIKKAGH